jgi:putative FmdB family regulatory protein
MPIYEFQCKECNNKFEVLVRNSSQTVKCPACSSDKLERLFSLFGFSSKGSSSKGNLESSYNSSSSSCSGCRSKNCSTCK